MSCLNEIIYTHENTIQDFLKEFGTKNILKNNDITYSVGKTDFLAARDLYYKLKDNPAYASEYEEMRTNDNRFTEESLQNRVFIAYSRGITYTAMLLDDFFNAIEQYTVNTINSMLNQRYVYTLEQLADMLCIAPKYVTNNFMRYLDYIKLSNFVRYVISEEIENKKERVQDLQSDTHYWRKHIFISRESILNFLIEYFKYTEIRTNISIEFKSDKFKQAFLKYKTKAMFKKQIKNIVKIKEQHINKELKFITIEEASNIIDKSLKMESGNTLKSSLKKYREDKLDVFNIEYKYITIEDTQLYNFLSMQSYKRYQLQIDEMANKMFIRYSLDGITEKEGRNYIKFNMNQEAYINITENGTIEDFLVNIL